MGCGPLGWGGKGRKVEREAGKGWGSGVGFRLPNLTNETQNHKHFQYTLIFSGSNLSELLKPKPKFMTTVVIRIERPRDSKY